MITQLLIPKGDTELKNQIEEVGGGGEEDEETDEYNEIDWYFQQTPNQELNHPHYLVQRWLILWFNYKFWGVVIFLSPYSVYSSDYYSDKLSFHFYGTLLQNSLSES